MELKERLGRTDYIALAVIWSFLIFRCALLGGGLMWSDELFSFRIIHDPSISHMLHALGDQSDGGAPGYYLTAKAWSSLFSGNPLSLRMHSTVGFCAGFTVLWIMLRRSFDFFPTLLTFVIIFSHSLVFAFETLNIRFYGLMFALVSLATFLGVQFCQSERPELGLLAANVLTSAALVLCHPLAGFYSAAIFLGVVISDLILKPLRIRLLVILSYLAGWTAILLWLKQFFRQADLNNPSGWIPRPSYLDFIVELNSEIQVKLLLIFLALLGLSICLSNHSLFSGRLGRPHNPPGLSHHGYLPIGLSLIGLLPFFWLFSRIRPTNSIFIPRYLIGTSIGWMILLVLFISAIFKLTSFRLTFISSFLFFVFVLFTSKLFWKPAVEKFFVQSTGDPREFLTGISDRAFGHDELNIVCPSPHYFQPRQYYSPDSVRYYYLFNLEAASSPSAPLGTANACKLMMALKRNYPDTNQIEDEAEFLSKNPAFLLLDVPGSHWPELYLKSGAYKINRLEPDHPLTYDVDGEVRLLLVERLP